MQLKIEVAVRGADLLGECPIWDDRTRTLWWVDSRGPAVRRFEPSTGVLFKLELKEAIGSIAFRKSGGMLAAMKSGIFFLDPESGRLEAAAQPEKHLPGNRFNDGRCDRAGRFWAGTMNDVTRAPVGSLYRLDADLACTPLRNAVIIPNGLAWSPDGRTLYFADTMKNTIWAYDYDCATGAATRERVWVDASPGRPDGSCVDADGCVWNAQYGAGRVVRYIPVGKIDREIELPVSNVTCCCFGGERLDVLYVTSATQRLTPEELARQPLAGSLFSVRPGVQGLPESRFAG